MNTLYLFTLKLFFTFFLLCRDGLSPDSGLLGRYCGFSIPDRPVLTSGNRARVEFRSGEDLVRRTGFRLKWNTGRGLVDCLYTNMNSFFFTHFS